MEATPVVRSARLVASLSAYRVGRHLRAAQAATAAAEWLDARLVIGDEPDQIAAAQADVDLVILDGHGYVDDASIGRLPMAALRTASRGVTAPGFVLGCCWGAAHPFLDALTRCMDAPTTLLCCAGIARFEHAEPLYVELLRQLACCTAGPLTPERTQEIMRLSLATVSADYPRRDWTRWQIIPLPRGCDDQEQGHRAGPH